MVPGPAGPYPLPLLPSPHVRVQDAGDFSDAPRLCEAAAGRVRGIAVEHLRHEPQAGVADVRAERRDGGLMLAVLDEGPGLPAGRETEIFETFRRIEGSDRSAAGTGLGLAIVKGFAEAMGIAVAAANRTDRSGACFSLTFPPALLIGEEAT